MRIVTWNVNSLKARQDYVTLYLDAEAPDVLCIQELKLEDDQVPVDMFTERGYHVAIHGQRQWNGVLIASKFPLEHVHKGLAPADEGESRLIAAHTGGVRFVNLYCPQGQSEDSPKFQYKLSFFDALIAWLGENIDADEPLVVLGDINIAPKDHDIWNPKKFVNVPSFHPLEHQRWARLLELGLQDVVEPHIEPGTFSFWDYRGGAFRFNHGMRIDHVLATPALAARVTSAWVDRDWRKKKDGLTTSDHAPVGIAID